MGYLVNKNNIILTIVVLIFTVLSLSTAYNAVKQKEYIEKNMKDPSIHFSK